MPYFTHEPRDDWIHEDGKVVLIGNAAASYPSPGVFGSCVAVEDAEVLGTLLRALRRKDQLPTLLSAFEELRMDRSAAVASVDAQMFDAWTNSPAPAGPVDVVTPRNAEDEEAIAKQWDQFFQMCGYNVFQTALYDATEKAEEWLAQWPGVTAEVDQLPEPVLVEKEVAAHVMT
jgi:salicylate hydroxylase